MRGKTSAPRLKSFFLTFLSLKLLCDISLLNLSHLQSPSPDLSSFEISHQSHLSLPAGSTTGEDLMTQHDY